MAIDLSQGGSNLQWPNPQEANPNAPISPVISGNYVSPEQATQMRLYANALSNNAMKMPVKNGWQGLAQMANATMGGILGNYADNQQRNIVNEGIQGSTPYYNAINSINGGTQQGQGQNTVVSNLDQGGFAPPTGAQNQSYKGGSFTSTADEDAFNKAYALSKGVDPNYVHGITAAEGLYAPGANHPSYVDKEKDGTPFSYGSFQMNVHPGALGGMARSAGIDPADPAQQMQTNMFAINQLAKGDASPWRTDKFVEGYRASHGIQDYSVPRVNPDSGPLQAWMTQHGQAPASGTPQTTQNGDPSGPTNGQNGAPPTVNGVNGSTVNGPLPQNPYQIAALRGGTGGPPLTPAMMARIAADPTVPQSVKDGMNRLVEPQVVNGPLGVSYITSMNGALNGAQPRVFTNTGQMVPFKAGGVEANNYLRFNPATNSVSSNLIIPGQGVNMNGGATPPPPATNGGTTTPPVVDNGGTPAAGGAISRAPYTPKTPVGNYIPPLDTQNGLGGLVNWGSSVKAGEAAQAEDQKSASEQLKASQESLPGIQNVKNNLNQVRGYMDALSKTKDPNTVFGPLEPHAKEVMGILNQLGIGGSSLQDSLGNLQGISKGLNQIVGNQSLALEGTNGRALAAALHLAEQSSPNENLSYQGIVKTMDSLEKIMDYRQNYELAKQKWINQNHSLLGFNQEWQDGIQGKDSNIPEAQPMVLSKTPMADFVSKQDGKHYAKVPSTDSRGYRYVPFEETQ